MLTKLKLLILQGRLQFIWKFFYDLIISLELLIQRILAAFPRKRSGERDPKLADLTIVIKTFERPETLFRLVKSIDRFYPSIRIIVADDSARPTELDRVDLLRMPYNSGISVGRNEALKQVKTKYTLLLDDDFVFCRETRLVPNLNYLEENPQVDILGGQVIDLPFYSSKDYSKVELLPTPQQSVFQMGTVISGLPVYDKIANFFICRTNRVRKIGWDPLLKKVEHGDFFTRARGHLVTVYNESFKCLHAPTPFDEKYMKFRKDFSFERQLLKKKYCPDSEHQ